MPSLKVITGFPVFHLIIFGKLNFPGYIMRQKWSNDDNGKDLVLVSATFLKPENFSKIPIDKYDSVEIFVTENRPELLLDEVPVELTDELYRYSDQIRMANFGNYKVTEFPLVEYVISDIYPLPSVFRLAFENGIRICFDAGVLMEDNFVYPPQIREIIGAKFTGFAMKYDTLTVFLREGYFEIARNVANYILDLQHADPIRIY